MDPNVDYTPGRTQSHVAAQAAYGCLLVLMQDGCDDKQLAGDCLKDPSCRYDYLNVVTHGAFFHTSSDATNAFFGCQCDASTKAEMQTACPDEFAVCASDHGCEDAMNKTAVCAAIEDKGESYGTNSVVSIPHAPATSLQLARELKSCVVSHKRAPPCTLADNCAGCSWFPRLGGECVPSGATAAETCQVTTINHKTMCGTTSQAVRVKPILAFLSVELSVSLSDFATCWD